VLVWYKKPLGVLILTPLGISPGDTLSDALTIGSSENWKWLDLAK
jgi:hypothetical protein